MTYFIERVMEPIGFGSKVRLRSGGPIMLVVDLPQPNPAAVLASWLDANGEPIEASFFVTSLHHVREHQC